jgi:hypothetical protein
MDRWTALIAEGQIVKTHQTHEVSYAAKDQKTAAHTSADASAASTRREKRLILTRSRLNFRMGTA